MRPITFILVTAIVMLPNMVLAQTSPASQPTWQGFARRDFVVDGRPCILVLPNKSAPGKPWIWRTEFFGNEPQADVALLGRGFHVAYMNVQNMYGAPVAMEHMEALHVHLTKELSLSPKPVLEGYSRGGLFALNWAYRNPDKVAAIYLDAPVCDFRTWPRDKSPRDWQRLKEVYGFKTDEEAMTSNLNPIERLEPLAKASIPILIVAGDADQTVPFEKNARELEKRYKQFGGPVQLIVKPGADHHPHSLKDPKPIVDFVVEAAGPHP